MRKLRTVLLEARGRKSRRQVVDDASTIPGSHPDFCEEDVRRFEDRAVDPPREGWKLRTHCAALDVPWTEALKLIGSDGYWPPVGESEAESPTLFQELRLLLSKHGKRIVGRDESTRRITIQL